MTLLSRLFARMFKMPAAETYDTAIERDIKVPMSDGVVLLADHYYPRKNPNVPTLLVRSCYGRSGMLGVMYGHLFAERGYQALIESCRGTAGSGGKLNPFFDEHSDGIDTIEWIKKQSWFNGKLATMGGSYLGYTQWALAADAAKSLSAMALTVTASQFRGQTYPGDSLSLQDPFSWTLTMGSPGKTGSTNFKVMLFGLPSKKIRHLPLGDLDNLFIGKKVDFWQDWLKNSEPEYEWWKPADFSESVKRVNVPVNTIAGWYDIFLPWQLDDYVSLKEAGYSPYLTVGPWQHTSMKVNEYGLAETLTWFNVKLKGKHDQLRKLPVHIFVMGLKEWKDFEEWPPRDYNPENWYLQTGKKLATVSPASSDPDTYVYDPADPTPSIGGVVISKGGSQNNRKLETRADVLTFTSDLLEKDTEVIGPVSAEIYIKSNREYADFFARVCDVYPSNKSMNVCDGIRRIRPGKPEPEPDGTIKVKIELWPTAYMFKKGHSIRLQVSSGAFPRFARNLGTGQPLATGVDFLKAEQKIYHDPAHQSAIILPAKRYP